MKIFIYILAAASGVFGFLALVKAIEGYLAGTGFDGFMIVLAALGLGLAKFWSNKAKAFA